MEDGHTLANYNIQKESTLHLVVYLRPIEAAVNGYNGVYDGKPHGISVAVSQPTSGASIKYGLSEGNCTLNESTAITNVVDSQLIVFYEIKTDGYPDKIESATVVITKGKAAVTSPAAKELTPESRYPQKRKDDNFPGYIGRDLKPWIFLMYPRYI